MRFLLTCILLIGLGVGLPLHAQTLQIAATGTTTGSSSTETFTFSETFNLADAVTVSSDPTEAIYQDPSGSSTLSFNGVNVAGTAPVIEIFSNNESVYGFEFAQKLGNNSDYGFQLLSADSAVAPSLSLANVRTIPLDEFFSGIGNIAVYTDTVGDDSFQGSITSFTVAAPEPSSVTLSIAAAAVFLWLRTRQRRGV